MGFAIEYTLPSGTSGIIFFAATDMTEAFARKILAWRRTVT
jgi:hypothetical protein